MHSNRYTVIYLVVLRSGKSTHSRVGCDSLSVLASQNRTGTVQVPMYARYLHFPVWCRPDGSSRALLARGVASHDLDLLSTYQPIIELLTVSYLKPFPAIQYRPSVPPLRPVGATLRRTSSARLTEFRFHLFRYLQCLRISCRPRPQKTLPCMCLGPIPLFNEY